MTVYIQLSNAVARLRARITEEVEGAAAVEYGLIIALIAAAVITVVAVLGDDIAALFTDVSTAIDTETGS